MANKRKSVDGKALEELIRKIELVRGEDSMQTPVKNTKITDEDGCKREVDVLLTFVRPDGRGNYKIAIECKDYKRPVSIGSVEEFAAKIIKLRAASIVEGILISSSGFTKGAKMKLESYSHISGTSTIQSKTGLNSRKPEHKSIIYAIELCNKCFKIDVNSQKELSFPDGMGSFLDSDLYALDPRNKHILRMKVSDFIRSLITMETRKQNNAILTDESISEEDAANFNESFNYNLAWHNRLLFLNEKLDNPIEIIVHFHLFSRELKTIESIYEMSSIGTTVNSAKVTISSTDKTEDRQLSIVSFKPNADEKARVGMFTSDGEFKRLKYYRKLD